MYWLLFWFRQKRKAASNIPDTEESNVEEEVDQAHGAKIGKAGKKKKKENNKQR